MAWRKLKKSRTAMISLSIVLAYLFIGIGCEVYTVFCEAHNITPLFALTDETNCYAPPSPAHWCGTDYQGRDVLARAVAGIASALKVGFVASVIASVIGVCLGAFA
ncbi:MAG: hypothetical protein J6C40_08775 [Lentisphaeria bacterium]|nr:hypothetical protein [Lentisphaeria bacterium]